MDIDPIEIWWKMKQNIPILLNTKLYYRLLDFERLNIF